MHTFKLLDSVHLDWRLPAEKKASLNVFPSIYAHKCSSPSLRPSFFFFRSLQKEKKKKRPQKAANIPSILNFFQVPSLIGHVHRCSAFQCILSNSFRKHISKKMTRIINFPASPMYALSTCCPALKPMPRISDSTAAAPVPVLNSKSVSLQLHVWLQSSKITVA